MYMGFIGALIMSCIAAVLNEENASSLLSGYNTMSDEHKKMVDFKGITKIYKWVFNGIAIVLVVLNLLYFVLKNEKFLMIGCILAMTWGFLPLFFLGSQYDKNQYKKREKVVQIIVISILFLLGLFISYSIYSTPLNELKF